MHHLTFWVNFKTVWFVNEEPHQYAVSDIFCIKVCQDLPTPWKSEVVASYIIYSVLKFRQDFVYLHLTQWLPINNSFTLNWFYIRREKINISLFSKKWIVCQFFNFSTKGTPLLMYELLYFWERCNQLLMKKSRRCLFHILGVAKLS